MSEQYRIGRLRLEVEAFRLWRGEEPIRAQPKVLELLILLARRPGELVDRARIQEALWPGVHVSENSVPQVLHKLRDALGEDAPLLETVPRKGVRLREAEVLAPVLDVRPSERDRFVGRAAELAELDRLLADGARLVTVTGIGGIGKTRLVTRRAVEGMGGWLCDLEDTTDVAGLLDRVAGALRVQLGDRPLAELGRLLARQGRRELVLDGFDGLVEHAEPTLGRWLDQAPELRIVVTSRQVLGLRGETVLPLLPLEEPDAIALFVERATAAGPIPPDRDRLPELVALLDRHPLALELAASWTRTLSVPELLERLDDRFRLLVARGRTGRHASLRAVLDLGWEALDPVERDTLGRLSVFEDGFATDAVEAVVASDEALDVLSTLIDRSWVVRTDRGFAMLSLVREYVAARLVEDRSPEVLRDAEIRHGRWAATLDRPGRFPDHRPPGLARLIRERENLMVACRRALARGDLEVAVATVAAAALPAQQRNEDLVALLDRVLASPLPPALFERAVRAAATLAYRRGVSGDVRRHVEAALSNPVDGRAEARLWYLLAQLDLLDGRPEAEVRFDRALGLARLENDGEIELAARALGAHFRRLVADEHSRAELEAGLARSRELRDPVWERAFLARIGRWHIQRGEQLRALAYYEQALATPADDAEAPARLGVAQVTAELGRFDPERFLAAIRASVAVGDWMHEAFCEVHLAAALVDEDRAHEADAHVEAAMALFDPEDGYHRRWAHLIRARIRAVTGDLEGAWESFRTASWHDPTPHKLVSLVEADLYRRSGDPRAAVVAADRALAQARKGSYPLEWARALCVLAEARRELGTPDPALLDEARALAEIAGIGPGAWVARSIERLAS